MPRSSASSCVLRRSSSLACHSCACRRASFLACNASSAIWNVLQSGVVHQLLKGQTVGNPLLIGQSGDVSEVQGDLQADGQMKFSTNGNGIWFMEAAGGSVNKALFYDNLDDLVLTAGRQSAGGNVILNNSAGQLLSITGTSGAYGQPNWFAPAVQTPTNNSTIGLTGMFIRVNPASAVTGIILTAGQNAGQQCEVANISTSGANSLTFASSGSNVGGGSNIMITPGHKASFTWDSQSNQWITLKSA